MEDYLPSWAKRFPELGMGYIILAAIEKAEKILDETCTCSRTECRIDRGGLTATVVALARALWDSRAMMLRYLDMLQSKGKYAVALIQHVERTEIALRAFAEEMEAL